MSGYTSLITPCFKYLIKKLPSRELIMEKRLYISRELIDNFKLLFPNTLPKNRSTTPDQIAFLHGQQSVIDRMEFLYEDDQPDEN